LQRLFHRLALDDAGRHDLDFAGLGGVDRAEPVDGRPSASTTRPTIAGPTGHLEHARGAADFVPLAQLQVVPEDHGADVVFLEVQPRGR